MSKELVFDRRAIDNLLGSQYKGHLGDDTELRTITTDDTGDNTKFVFTFKKPKK